jgi:hypothetical protein
MKLTPTQVEQTLDQFPAQAIPETHPVLLELTKLYGEHTFFLDGQGLSIVESTLPDGDAKQKTGVVINLATWADETKTQLAPHEPEPTDIAVELAA